MKKILIIEDDSYIADLEKDYLEVNQFQVEVISDGKKGLDQALLNDYDLILLDIMLPTLSGFEVLKAIRKVKQTPIILVTAKKEDIDTIRGLGLGADDYIIKPFSPSVLVARVKAHIRIHESLSKPVEQKIILQNITIYPASHRVYKNNQEIVLPNKEYELLMLFFNHPDMVFSKEMIFEKIWGMDSNGDTATVTVHINRLREKIEDDPSKPTFIETVWGVGYRLNARKLES